MRSDYMKIGIDCRSAQFYKGTGIGTYLTELIKSMAFISNKNILLYGVKNDIKGLDIVTNYEVKYSHKKTQNFWNDMLAPCYPENTDIDILHIPQNGIGIPENYKALSHNKNCKIVTTLHDIIPLKLPQTTSKTFLKIFNDNISRVIETSSLILTVSEFSKSEICNTLNIDNKKVIVTKLAANEIYKPLSKGASKKVLSCKYGITSPFILFVGGYTPRKNLLGLITAFSMLKSSLREKYNLLIVAKMGSSFEDTRNAAIKYGVIDRCLFIDYIEEDMMPFLYNAAACFVFPSFYEGFGLPVIEAMSCGTPVITSNCASLPEISGTAAITVNPNDTYDLSKSITDVLEDSELQLSLSKKSIGRANEFSWERTAAETIEAYESLEF
jgi:glycosyltransferase involved in cell wall biosynthesis